jgi:hypothetical protein
VPTPPLSIVWHGRVTLQVNETGVDLDTTPAKQASGSAGNTRAADLLLEYSSRTGGHIQLVPVNSALAEWSESRRPSAEDCLKAVATRATRGLPPAPGETLCVQTAWGDLSFVMVLRSEYDNLLLGITGLGLDVTQWG